MVHVFQLEVWASSCSKLWRSSRPQTNSPHRTWSSSETTRIVSECPLSCHTAPKSKCVRSSKKIKGFVFNSLWEAHTCRRRGLHEIRPSNVQEHDPRSKE